MSWELITDNTWQISIFFACAFFAGIVRGCIGFGFSILMIASTSLFLDPTLLVPTVVLLEVAASIHMLPTVWKEALWRELSWILIGMVVGIPIGVYMLSIASENSLKLSASVIIFLLTIFVFKGASYRGVLTTGSFILIGLISGFFSGVAAAGGIVAATCLSFASLPIKQVRATLVVYLLFTGLIFVVSAFFTSHLDTTVLHTVTLAIIPMAAGVIIGGKLFRFLEEDKLRLLILICLSVLSIVGIAKALLSFYQ